jgi:D-mannonate dehydratase
MNEVKDYRSMIRHGDIKNLMRLTGLSRYLIETRIEKGDWEMNEILKTYFEKRLQTLKNQLNDYTES